MSRWARRRQQPVIEAAARVRDGYDRSLSETGVVLFQQSAPGVDGHFVSASMTATLGWNAGAFREPGTLRRLVHPDDLGTFRRLVPVGPVEPAAGMIPDPAATNLTTSTPTDHDQATHHQASQAAPLLDNSVVIDLTDTATQDFLLSSGEPVVAANHIAPPVWPPRDVSPFDAPPSATQAKVAEEPIIRFLTPDGTYREMLVRLAPNAPDAPVRGALVDMSVAEKARVVQRRFAEMVDRSLHGHIVLDFLDDRDPSTLVVRSANRSARRVFNLEHAEIDGTPLHAVFGESSAQLFRSALFDVAHTGEPLTAERLTFVEVPNTYVDLRVDRLDDGTLGVTMEDVTRSVAVEERLRHQASHDPLTGLPNRTLLNERLSIITSSLPADRYVSLLLIDMEGLREINHRYGHHIGDQLLVELGRRLVREIPGCEIVARVGGDEFAILTLPSATMEEATARAHAVEESLDRPINLDGDAHSLSVRIGAAMAPTHGDDPRTLMRSADTALQRARTEARTFAMFDPEAERSSVRRIGLLTELRQGLANQELELRYQPMVELRTGRVTKVEALLRWQREEGGARQPVELLEMAEQSGLIQPLTRWILGESARAAGRLDRPEGHTVVSANLSLRNLYDSELLSFLDLLAASGELPTDRVEIEINETELMDDPIRAQEIVAHLAGLGLRVVVDEFGTGHTSLATISRLALSGLKIDRGFITTLSSVDSDAAVVRATIDLAHELGLTVSAEGVGDAATLALLTEMGCDFAQGFHLSEPVAFDTLPRRVSELEHALQGWIGSAGVLLD